MKIFEMIKEFIETLKRGFDYITLGIYFSIWIMIEICLAIKKGDLRNHIEKYFDNELVMAQFVGVFSLFVLYCTIFFVRFFNQPSTEEIKKDKQTVLLVFDELYKVPIFFGSLLIVSGCIDIARIFYYFLNGNQPLLPYIWTGLTNFEFGIFLLFLSALINGVLKRH